MKIAITVLLMVSIGCKNEATTPKPTASLEELQTQQYIESSVSALRRDL